MILSDEAVAILKKYFIFDRIFNLFDYDYDMTRLYDELTALRRDTYENNYRFIFLHYDTEYYPVPHQPQPGLTISNLQKILENLDISNYFCLILTHQDIQSMCNVVKQDHAPSNECSIAVITNHLHKPIHPKIENINLDLNEKSISKKYISLNGAGRFHRRILVALLQDRNLIDSGMVSYRGENYVVQ